MGKTLEIILELDSPNYQHTKVVAYLGNTSTVERTCKCVSLKVAVYNNNINNIPSIVPQSGV